MSDPSRLPSPIGASRASLKLRAPKEKETQEHRPSAARGKLKAYATKGKRTPGAGLPGKEHRDADCAKDRPLQRQGKGTARPVEITLHL
jgi:hypothetical protein